VGRKPRAYLEINDLRFPNGGGYVARYGPHGHEIVGEEIERIRCSNCGNRVTLEEGDAEVKCPHCGNLVKRPKQQKPKES
jgi:DNA-directed RNA polymerase subunit RPC12/RpoP